MEVLEVRYEGVHKEGHHLHQREERAPVWEVQVVISAAYGWVG